jgi:hypothetical protein
MPRQRRLTEFLIKLNQEPDLLQEYKHANRRGGALRRYGLDENDPIFQPGATVEQMQQAVREEDPEGMSKIETWILVD